jgi:hypothetical protein
MAATKPHYKEPGWFTRNVFNRAIAGLALFGVSIWGSRVLDVPGRTSGKHHRTPVNLLDVEGQKYLVSPRGQTQWVRNVRANDGRLTLLLGWRVSRHIATEVADVDKTELLRSYLKRWKFEVGVFFDGVDASSSDEEIQAIAPKHPVFRLTHDPDARDDVD